MLTIKNSEHHRFTIVDQWLTVLIGERHLGYREVQVLLALMHHKLGPHGELGISKGGYVMDRDDVAEYVRCDKKVVSNAIDGLKGHEVIEAVSTSGKGHCTTYRLKDEIVEWINAFDSADEASAAAEKGTVGAVSNVEKGTVEAVPVIDNDTLPRVPNDDNGTLAGVPMVLSQEYLRYSPESTTPIGTSRIPLHLTSSSSSVPRVDEEEEERARRTKKVLDTIEGDIVSFTDDERLRKLLRYMANMRDEPSLSRFSHTLDTLDIVCDNLEEQVHLVKETIDAGHWFIDSNDFTAEKLGEYRGVPAKKQKQELPNRTGKIERWDW